ncbi:MAG: hypothetical protein H0V76_05940 [Blastocatellia bacterium]|nr:hypothetical protein [Blastocatellia bacterium]
MSVVFFFALTVPDAHAQRRYSKTFPAGNNVRIQLTNRSGTVTVEGWNRNEVHVSAYLETPAANIDPKDVQGTIYINLVKDNQGRSDIGNVNFSIKVPFESNVDIETLMGNLIVSNVRGGLVRAQITSEGDITLTNIMAGSVHAQNGIGDIFFDGEIAPGGTYRFISMRGNISLRIPFSSSFRLVATAPSTRNIALGSFANSNLNYTGDGRRVVGRFGDGASTLTVTNQRGNITFISR